MDDLLNWLTGLDPVFAFLLVLPFIVAAVGLLGDGLRRLWRTRHRARAPQEGTLRVRTNKPAWR